jgi:hypothetical protein
MITRTLALSATALAGANEVGTLRPLKTLRREPVDPVLRTGLLSGSSVSRAIRLSFTARVLSDTVLA